MEDMNPILAGIYGTGGHEKVASAGGDTIETLSDLALALVLEGYGEDAEKLASENGGFEKLANEHDQVLERLVYFDEAGRAFAQQEVTNMEIEAFENGNTEPLEEFLGIQSQSRQEKIAAAARRFLQQ